MAWRPRAPASNFNGMRDFSGTFTPLGRMLLAMACAVVVLAGMRAASSVIGPIVIALLITVAWSPGSDWLRRRGWNPTVAALTGIVLGVVVVVLIGVLAWSSLAQLQERLPAYQPQMEALWLSVSGLLAQLPFDTSRLTSLSALQPQSLVGWAVAAVRRVTAATGGMILLLLIMAFMMIEAQRYPAKLHDALAMDEDRESAVNGFVRSLRSYVVLNSVFGLAAAVLNTIVLFALGVDFALLWGVASFLLSFLPNVGFVLALVPPALLALLEFGLARSLMVIVAFTAVNLVVDTVIKPRMVGESLDLSPFVVVISLVFWGWLLGPVGALLAVPLSVGLKFLFEAFDESRWLAHLLSDKSPSADSGPPSAPG